MSRLGYLQLLYQVEYRINGGERAINWTNARGPTRAINTPRRSFLHRDDDETYLISNMSLSDRTEDRRRGNLSTTW